MSFLNPIAFWGLLFLLIPLLIHLLSKKQKHTVYFGSNRFLADQETTSASSIQLSDYGLLLIRSLLIASLICVIAQLVKPDAGVETIKYIEYGLHENQDYESVISPISSEERVNYFTYEPGIKNKELDFYPSAFTFINHLNKIGDSISVFTFSEQQHFVGSEQFLQGNIDWNIIPKKEFVSKETLDDEPMSVEIMSAVKSESHKKEFIGLVNSIKEYLPFELRFNASDEWLVTIDTTSTNRVDHKIHWSTNGQQFSFDKTFDYYKMTGFLSKHNMLESNFPLALTQALIKSRTNSTGASTKIYEPRQKQFEPNSGTLLAKTPKNWMSLTNYLWLCLALLLLFERYFSLRKVKE